MSGYRIAELAERSGFSSTTLRYYEQVGVLDPPMRTPGGYRLYDEAVLDRLAFVDRAKRMGLALEEIAELVRLHAAGDCPPVQHRLRMLLDARRDAARRQAADLIAFAGQLDEVANRLDAAAAPKRCGPGCRCEVTLPPSPGRLGRRPLQAVAPKPRPAAAITCSLDDAALQSRLADWRAVTSRARDVEPTTTGAMLRLPPDPELAATAARLASAEASCCPFLSLSLIISEGETELRIDAPPGAEELARALVERRPRAEASE